MTGKSLKQRRQQLNLTQVEVAKALSVSQPTYQNYEAGTLSIPEDTLRRLMKVLKLTREEIEGKPRMKDESPESNELPDDYYWGEVTIHFRKGSALVLSIGYGEYKRLFRQLQDGDKFFHVFSLSNQMVAVRRAAVTDVYLADDGCDTYGPEQASYEPVGRWDTSMPRYWQIVDDLVGELKQLEQIEEEYGEDVVTRVARGIGLNMPEDIDQLIEQGNVAADERESVLAEAEKALAEATRLVRDITWQLSIGKMRRASAWNCELNRFWWIQDTCDPDAQGHMIIVENENKQTAFINPDELDYVSIPEHQYRAAEEEEWKREEALAAASKKQKRKGRQTNA